MRVCVFCGNLADSREHVFGQELIKRMRLGNGAVRYGHRLEDKVQWRPEHDAGSLVCRMVCKNCNNGWMSELESWFLNNAGFLIEPEWPRLADLMIEELQKEGRTLAKWALKTAIMIDRAGIKRMIPDSLTSDLYNDVLPASLRVDLAQISERAFLTRVAPGFMISNGGGPIDWQSHKDGLAWQVLIQLNHFAIRVFCAPDSKARHINPDCTVIHAYPAEKILQNRYVYPSLDQFMANLWLEVGSRVALEGSHLR
jgi:hypothetical protein